jgi:CheY-like chemotaxis protein
VLKQPRVDRIGVDCKTKKAPFVILVADDDAMIRDLAVAMLGDATFVVLTAKTGHEALEILNNNPGDVHLALCNIRMPGPSGMELRNLILKDRPRTAVALFSGDTSFSGIPDDVPLLEKPFTAGQFRERVRELLGIE